MVDVYLNEKFIGSVDKAEDFIKDVKDKRRSSKIPFNLSVSYDESFNEIYLNSTKGRSMRLLIRVEDGKPMLTKEHVDKLINNEITISSKPLVDFFHNTFNVPIGDKSLIIEMPNMPSSKLFLSNLIRGIIDGDGHVPHSRHGNLKISSGSEKFLYQLKDKFSFLEINVKNPKFGSTCFELYIPKEYCSKLYEILYNNTNFYYPRKKHNWEQILNT